MVEIARLRCLWYRARRYLISVAQIARCVSSLTTRPSKFTQVCCYFATLSIVDVLKYLPFLLLDKTTIVDPGDNITLKAGLLMRTCKSVDPTDCAEYTRNYESSALVTVPASVITPKLSISGPSTMSACDDMILDPSGSYGAGTRAWKTIKWSVESDHSTWKEIEDHLNTNYSSGLDNLVTIPNRLLREETDYSITISVTNFLDSSSLVTKTVRVGGPGIPSITILGPGSITAYRAQSISLRAQAIIPICVTDYSSVSYVWKLYKGIQYEPWHINTKKAPNAYGLAPYSLEANSFYTLKVTVTYISSGGNPISSSSTVNLALGTSGVKAVILGGAERTLDASQVLTLDGSYSYNIDYPDDKSKLQYAWDCTIASGSGFGGDCGIDGSILQGDILIINPGSLDSATTYRFDLLVFDGNATSSSSASTKVTILAESVPDVSLSSIADIYASDSKVILTGMVVADVDMVEGLEDNEDLLSITLSCDQVNMYLFSSIAISCDMNFRVTQPMISVGFIRWTKISFHNYRLLSLSLILVASLQTSNSHLLLSVSILASHTHLHSTLDINRVFPRMQ